MKNTLIKYKNTGSDNTVMWIEGAYMEIPFEVQGFSMCGGLINTNAGITLSKTQLQYIVDNMNEDSLLKVCGQNWAMLRPSEFTEQFNETYKYHKK